MTPLKNGLKKSTTKQRLAYVAMKPHIARVERLREKLAEEEHKIEDNFHEVAYRIAGQLWHEVNSNASRKYPDEEVRFYLRLMKKLGTPDDWKILLEEASEDKHNPGLDVLITWINKDALFLQELPKCVLGMFFADARETGTETLAGNYL